MVILLTLDKPKIDGIWLTLDKLKIDGDFANFGEVEN